MSNQFKELINQFVEDKQGCKLMDLCTSHELLSVFGTELPSVIAEMVQDGDLVEVEYLLPSMDYRVKSFILPKNTKVVTDRG